MPELASPTTNVDPTLTAPNPTSEELKSRVESVIGFFGQEFGLEISPDGSLATEPTQEQLDSLKQWHERTSEDGVDMPDFDTFTAKMVLARALMPQTTEDGEVLYLFGKGVGAELVLQGEVSGRTKKLEAVPYRTHSDFEIYAIPGEDYDSLPNSGRFRAVFGSQEIYPTHKTKGLSELPPDLLHRTAESVDFGGITFLVPRLEMQFVDKYEKANEKVERQLREKTDAEWLASTYDLDKEVVHAVVDDFVIAPEVHKFPKPEEFAVKEEEILRRKVEQAKDNLRALAEEEGRAISEQEVNSSVSTEKFLANYGQNKGIELDTIVDPATGSLRGNVIELLSVGERKHQERQLAELSAKHEAVDEVLREAA